MAIDKNKAIANAQRFTQKGQLDRALKEYQAIVAEDPEDVRIWLKIGDLHTRKGAIPQAVGTYSRVAGYYSERGFFLKAVAVWKQILNIDPSYTEAHLKLAELYVQLGLAPDAIGQFELVVGAYERESRHRDSLALLKKIVELAPENIPNRIRLAEAHARQNESGKAVDEFKVVLDQLLSRERWDEAIQVGERVAYLAADDVENLRTLSEVYLRRGDARRALARLQACFKANPTDIPTLELLARAFSELGQTAKAISVYRELARLHEEAGNPPGRLEAFRRIIALDPTDVEAISLTGGGRPREAQKPLPPQVLFSQGITSTQGMQRLGAVAQPVETLSSEDLVARHLTDIDLLLKYGLGEHALQTTDKILGIDAEHEGALIKRKDIAIAIGRRDEAIASLLRLASVAERRNPDQAMIWLGEALQISPHHAEANQRMQRLSSGMAAGLRKTGPRPMAPAVIEAAPPDDDQPEFDLGALDLGEGDDLAPVVSGDPQASVDDLEFNFGDDDPAGARQSIEILAPEPEDDFAGLMDGGEDDFQDLLSDVKEPARAPTPRPAPVPEPARAPQEDFGDLLSGPRAAPTRPVMPLPPPPPVRRPALPPPPQRALAVPRPETTSVANSLAGIPGAPTPQPISDDFGDLGPMELPDDDFSDLLNDAAPAKPSRGQVSPVADDDSDASVVDPPLGDEFSFGDLLGEDNDVEDDARAAQFSGGGRDRARDEMVTPVPAPLGDLGEFEFDRGPGATREAPAEPEVPNRDELATPMPGEFRHDELSTPVPVSPTMPLVAVPSGRSEAVTPQPMPFDDLGDLLPEGLFGAPAEEDGSIASSSHSEFPTPVPAPVPEAFDDFGDLLPEGLTDDLMATASPDGFEAIGTDLEDASEVMDAPEAFEALPEPAKPAAREATPLPAGLLDAVRGLSFTPPPRAPVAEVPPAPADDASVEMSPPEGASDGVDVDFDFDLGNDDSLAPGEPAPAPESGPDDASVQADEPDGLDVSFADDSSADEPLAVLAVAEEPRAEPEPAMTEAADGVEVGDVPEADAARVGAQPAPFTFDLDIPDLGDGLDEPEIEEPPVDRAIETPAVHESLDALRAIAPPRGLASDDVASALADLLPSGRVPGPPASNAVSAALEALMGDGDEDPDRTVFAVSDELPGTASAHPRVPTQSAEPAAILPVMADDDADLADAGVDVEMEMGSLPGVALDLSTPDELGSLENVEDIEEFEEIEDFEEIDEGDDDDAPSQVDPPAAEHFGGLGPFEAIEAVPSGDVMVVSEDTPPLDDLGEFNEAPAPRRPMIDARTVMATFTFPNIEDELAEVDFLLESGLSDDAQEALEAAAAEHGWGHPAIQKRRNKIADLEALTREAEGALAIMAASEPTPVAPLAASSVSELNESDVAAHFDLGVAYMEMGQYKKAIAQLQKVAEVRERRAEALRVMALCDLQQGDAKGAAGRLEEALAVPGLTRDGKVGLLYDLATAYETLGNRIAARTQLKGIIDLGAGDFLDVRDRYGRLGGS